MPIYEYQCTNCNQSSDILQKISAEPVKICPHCSKETLVKLVSAAGFHLKGSGWYATDLKNKGKAVTDEPKDSTPKTETPAKSETTQ